MMWEEIYLRYREARARGGNGPYLQPESVQNRVARNTPDDWQWLISSLDDNERKWFVADVFRFQQLPEQLLVPMLRAGVMERDPSRNRAFIDPCVQTYGAARTCTALLKYLENGTNEEKAGAASALYWAWRPKPGEDMSELARRTRADMLREFVYNEDLQVRRRIIPHLTLNPEGYPEELRPLISRAIEIARAHPDKYTRHRIEIQLGEGGPLMAIPDAE